MSFLYVYFAFLIKLQYAVITITSFYISQYFAYDTMQVFDIATYLRSVHIDLLYVDSAQ